MVDVFEKLGMCCFGQYIKIRSTPYMRKVIVIHEKTDIKQVSVQVCPKFDMLAQSVYEVDGKEFELNAMVVVPVDCFNLTGGLTKDQYLQQLENQQRELLRIAPTVDEFLALSPKMPSNIEARVRCVCMCARFYSIVFAPSFASAFTSFFASALTSFSASVSASVGAIPEMELSLIHI